MTHGYGNLEGETTDFTGYTLYDRGRRAGATYVAEIDDATSSLPNSTLTESELVSQAPNEEGDPPSWYDFTHDGDDHRDVRFTLFDDIGSSIQTDLGITEADHTSGVMFRKFTGGWYPIAFWTLLPAPTATRKDGTKEIAEVAVAESPVSRMFASHQNRPIPRDQIAWLGNSERVHRETNAYGSPSSLYDFLDRFRTEFRNRNIAQP